MQIWDTAGQEKYHSLQGVFFYGSDGCVIVFDLTDSKSFDYLKTWKDEFIKFSKVKNPKEFPFVIVGNKSDLIAQRKAFLDNNQVDQASAMAWCKENGNYPYFETSAKSDINGKEIFETIGEKAYQKYLGNM